MFCFVWEQEMHMVWKAHTKVRFCVHQNVGQFCLFVCCFYFWETHKVFYFTWIALCHAENQTAKFGSSFFYCGHKFLFAVWPATAGNRWNSGHENTKSFKQNSCLDDNERKNSQINSWKYDPLIVRKFHLSICIRN